MYWFRKENTHAQWAQNLIDCVVIMIFFSLLYNNLRIIKSHLFCIQHLWACKIVNIDIEMVLKIVWWKNGYETKTDRWLVAFQSLGPCVCVCVCENLMLSNDESVPLFSIALECIINWICMALFDDQKQAQWQIEHLFAIQLTASSALFKIFSAIKKMKTHICCMQMGTTIFRVNIDLR